MFVLPNLFTVSSIFCGVYSITLSAGEPTGDNFYRAAVAIFFGSFFDAFDGRVARLTRTQSDFGGELDSLAEDRESTRLNSSHSQNSYALFCLQKKKKYCSSPNVD